MTSNINSETPINSLDFVDDSHSNLLNDFGAMTAGNHSHACYNSICGTCLKRLVDCSCQQTSSDYSTTDDAGNSIETFDDDEFHLNESLFLNCKYYNVEAVNNNHLKYSRDLFLIHFNIRSLQKNIDKLFHFVSQLKNSPDIIAITETKLNKSKICFNIDLTGYKFIHSDSCTKAGGVGFYIKSSLPYIVRTDIDLNLETVENMWLQVETNNRPTTIGVVYRHPEYSVDQLSNFSNSLEKILQNFSNSKIDFFITGDFNIDLGSLNSNRVFRNYADNLISYSIKCAINKPTRITETSKTLLDHLYTNNHNRLIFSGIIISDISDHFPIFAFICNSKAKTKKKVENFSIRDFSNFSVESFNDDLAIRLSQFRVDEIRSPHDQFKDFLTIFNDAVNSHAPRRRATRKEKQIKSKPWLSKCLLKSIKLKNKMYKQCLLNRFSYSVYKQYRNFLNKAIVGAKQLHYKKILADEKQNIGKVYDIVNQICKLKNKENLVPKNIIQSNGKLTSEPLEIAQTLNQYFVNIGCNMAKNIPEPSSTFRNPSTSIINSIFLSPSTPNEVSLLIDQLRNRKAVRHNDAETKFLKYSKSIISPVISDLFNLCIEKGIFPNCLKVAEVIPVFKNGDRDKPTNYRPISLLSQFDKVIEKMIFTRIYSYLEKNKLLSNKQFGFRPNSSTTYAISTLYDKLINNIDKDMYTCCIFLDLSKAFDTVDHGILLWKLKYYFGIRGSALKLIESYLSDRYQYTNISGNFSNQLKLQIGVPQGSCLGPLLFLMYINDLPLTSDFDTTLYADDTALMLCDRNINSLEVRVNSELYKVDQWLKRNKLSLNFGKTNYIVYDKQPHKVCTSSLALTLNNTSLKRVQSIKYLGVYFDEKLNWDVHINNLSLQLARCSGLFCKLRYYAPKETLCLLYYSLVYSKINYGILTWGTASKTLLHNLEVKINRILRIISFSSIYTPVETLYKTFNFLQLLEIYKLELGKFMYQLYHNKLPADFILSFKKISQIHSHETRQINTTTYFLPRMKKSLGHSLLAYRGVQLWRKIENDIKDRHWVSFKKQYKRCIISNR